MNSKNQQDSENIIVVLQQLNECLIFVTFMRKTHHVWEYATQNRQGHLPQEGCLRIKRHFQK